MACSYVFAIQFLLYIYSNENDCYYCIYILKYEQEENFVEIEFLEVIVFNFTCTSIILATRNKLSYNMYYGWHNDILLLRLSLVHLYESYCTYFTTITERTLYLFLNIEWTTCLISIYLISPGFSTPTFYFYFSTLYFTLSLKNND